MKYIGEGKWTSKYGESPYRVVGVSSISILLFSVLYGLIGGVRVGSGENSSIASLGFPHQVPPSSEYAAEILDLIYFSTTTFSTLGYGNSEPITLTIRLLAAFQSLLGTLLVALLLFSFSNRITR
ncbi:ion channel [Natrinema soli]|uniref:Ion channel n=1 Tax=Natrinema soli TaxID=1930624 RepID=A0ABD5SXG2_9EURY